MNRVLIPLLLFLIVGSSNVSAKSELPLYKNPKASVEERVNDLLSRMTLQEKVMQLNQYTLGQNTIANNIGKIDVIPAEVGSLIYFDADVDLRNAMQHRAMDSTRLGIPIIFAYDVIHGFRTIFPVPLAQACSFNIDMVQKVSAVSAQEAKQSGIDWTFSPMIDIAHDPRWGRVVEGYGEDPYLTGEMGKAAVLGYQNNGRYNIASCLKHYVGYGASEAGRDYVYTEVSRQTLWDTYLSPYIKSLEANPATVMSAFCNISGTPASANRYTLHDVLKEKLDFKGFVVSDWDAIRQFKDQGMAKDDKTAAMYAFNAGLDMDMMSNAYERYLAQLATDGKVDMKMVDDAVARVLKLKFELGLFEHPYIEKIADTKRFLLKENIDVAEQVAEESMILLKNNGNFLPLKDVKRIAFIGPLTDDRDDLLGSWHSHGEGKDVTTIKEAAQQEFGGKAKIDFAKGCDFEGDDTSMFDEAVDKASDADVVVLCLGEKMLWSGENSSRANIELPQIQISLMEAIKKTSKPIVLVLSNGRPLQLNHMEPLADAIIEMWQPGVAGGTPVVRILSGRVNPSGKLAITFPLTGGQIPIYYNRRPSSRPTLGTYQDVSSDPLYTFGYGLSYSNFKYGELKLSKTTCKKDETVTAEITVTNTSNVKGKETALWFIRCPYSVVTRPVKELRHFEKHELQPGESYTFKFEINPLRDLSTFDADGNRYLQSGEYDIAIGDKITQIEIE